MLVDVITKTLHTIFGTLFKKPLKRYMKRLELEIPIIFNEYNYDNIKEQC